MATEKGIVIKVSADGKAWVKAAKSSACEGCASKGFCSAGGGNDMEVEAVNAVGAVPGDKVVMSIKTSSLLKAAFLLYMVPVLCLVVGAVIGREIALAAQLNESYLSVVLGAAFFVVSVGLIRLKGSDMSKNDEYRPKIIRKTAR